MISPKPPAGEDLALFALERAVGPCLVLGPDLAVRQKTPGAEVLVGYPIPLGALAPRVLCGHAPERPLADALAEGRAVRALLAFPSGAADRTLEVEAEPLGGAGWLLRLRELPPTDLGAEGTVEFFGITTAHRSMKQVFDLVSRVAPSDVTVLVRGETGTGKELVAEAIHRLSPRREGPFRAINCAALTPTLLESELFGHARGAFTGAVKDHPGHFRLADGGTLFLDEVAEIPLDLQAKLLRVLQTRAVVPVGGGDAIPIDVRIVSATHRALREEVEAGRFRADLMYRLRVVPVFLPPLRERGDDVLVIAERLLARMVHPGGRRVTRIAPGARARLLAHPWPGNVRELINALEYALVIGDGPELLPAHLPPELGGAAAARVSGLAGASGGGEAKVGPARADPEAERVRRALTRAGGHRGRAAKLLGISRATLWRRMRALGLGDREPG